MSFENMCPCNTVDNVVYCHIRNIVGDRNLLLCFAFFVKSMEDIADIFFGEVSVVMLRASYLSVTFIALFGILSFCPRCLMFWRYTSWVVAGMQKIQTLWNRPDKNFIRNARGKFSFAAYAGYCTPSVVRKSLPYPAGAVFTTALCFNDACQQILSDAFGGSHGLRLCATGFRAIALMTKLCGKVLCAFLVRAGLLVGHEKLLSVICSYMHTNYRKVLLTCQLTRR